ncbi:hypothetical protein E2C01_046153 [Portunus trituberculatus]|uniref:Uncharacterized protein n=1 Tax=Portunus trituberculatus TaxID=210409 RepID=A0A5B7FX36_PORTR|nr:hypothetical protein [Portunus trituberculatus]
MIELGGEGVSRGGEQATSWSAEAGGAMPASSQHCTALVIHFSSSSALDHSRKRSHLDIRTNKSHPGSSSFF